MAIAMQFLLLLAATLPIFGQYDTITENLTGSFPPLSLGRVLSKLPPIGRLSPVTTVRSVCCRVALLTYRMYLHLTVLVIGM